MAKIYDSIMPLIKPARVATAAVELGETEKKVSSAADIILPALLGRMLKKGDTPEIEEVLKEAKHLKVHENYDKIWKGSGIDTHVNIGERMENRLLGTHDPKFNATVATHSGMKKEHADRLTNWVAGTIAAWFAGHLADGTSYKTLLDNLANEKAELRKDIPADIIAELGLGSILGASTAHNAAAHHTTAHKTTSAPAPKKKCKLGWLWWLLGVIVLALLLFFCLRSCKKEIVTHEQVTTIHNVDASPKFEAVKMILPDGTPVTMYRGHIESAIKAFLDSDKYKNATDAELRSVWFEFSDIDFEHNSATDLMAGSTAQLNSLVNVLKAYPGVKIKVGAFADKTGTHAVNYAISEKRAQNIEAAIEKAGHPADNVSIEGFGEKYAEIPEGASDDQRAVDRDIAMRFSK